MNFPAPLDSPRMSRMDRSMRSMSQPRGKRDSSVSSAYGGGGTWKQNKTTHIILWELVLLFCSSLKCWFWRKFWSFPFWELRVFDRSQGCASISRKNGVRAKFPSKRLPFTKMAQFLSSKLLLRGVWHIYYYTLFQIYFRGWGC